MDPEKEREIRIRVRAIVQSGEMTCDEADKVWAGHGSGSHCAACGDLIAPSEVEYEVDLAAAKGGILRLHRVCHAIWEEECEPERSRLKP